MVSVSYGTSACGNDYCTSLGDHISFLSILSPHKQPSTALPRFMATYARGLTSQAVNLTHTTHWSECLMYYVANACSNRNLCNWRVVAHRTSGILGILNSSASGTLSACVAPLRRSRQAVCQNVRENTRLRKLAQAIAPGSRRTSRIEASVGKEGRMERAQLQELFLAFSPTSATRGQNAHNPLISGSRKPKVGTTRPRAEGEDKGDSDADSRRGLGR